MARGKGMLFHIENMTLSTVTLFKFIKSLIINLVSSYGIIISQYSMLS